MHKTKTSFLKFVNPFCKTTIDEIDNRGTDVTASFLLTRKNRDTRGDVRRPIVWGALVSSSPRFFPPILLNSGLWYHKFYDKAEPVNAPQVCTNFIGSRLSLARENICVL